MRKILSLLPVAMASVLFCKAQMPQFAVVRPDGTTHICPTWDSAYSKAVDGDNIYMPGINLTQTITINKRLHIYGAGHSPDSSTATGVTSINNANMFIDSGAAGGSLEGIRNTTLFFKYSGKRINGYTIKRCRFEGTIAFHHIGVVPNDSLPTNVVVTESVVGSIDCIGGLAKGNFFIKNIIQYQITHPSFCTIKNNVFLYSVCCPLNGTIDNCTVEDNVFLYSSPAFNATACTSNFYNNLKFGSSPILNGCSGTGTETGTISVNSISDIFIAYGGSGNFSYADNYHLKPTCPGINAGTDGTDVGIYGTMNPTSEGWVPGNPHIYYKLVAPQTNASGQLPVQFKVRASN